MENRVTKVEEILKKFEKKQKRIERKYDEKEIKEELKEVELTLKRKKLHIERLQEELAKVNPNNKDLIEEYYKALQKEYNGFVDPNTNEKSEGTKYYIEKQAELNTRLLVSKAEKEKKHSQEIKDSENELRKNLTQEGIKIDQDINELELNMKQTLADMNNFKYEYEEYEYEDENGKKVIGKKIINGDKYREINEKYEDLKKDLINLKDAKKLCESKLKEFKDRDDEKAAQMAKAWNETKPEGKELKEEKPDKKVKIEEIDIGKERQEEKPQEEVEKEKVEQEKVSKEEIIEEIEPQEEIELQEEMPKEAELQEEKVQEEEPQENLSETKPNYVQSEEADFTSSIEEDIKIVIGRSGKIFIGDKKYRIPSRKIYNGTQLTDEEKLECIMGSSKCSEYIEGKTEQEKSEIVKNLDGAVISSIYATIIKTVAKNSSDNEKADDLMYKYVSSIEHAKNGKRIGFALEYDMKDLAQMGIWGTLTQSEVYEQDKLKIRKYAKQYERYGIAKQVGEYKRGLFSRIFGKLAGEKVLKLPTMEDEQVVAETYNQLKNRGITHKVEDNEFIESLKYDKFYKGEDGLRHFASKKIENEEQAQELKELHESQVKQEDEYYFDKEDDLDEQER